MPNLLVRTLLIFDNDHSVPGEDFDRLDPWHFTNHLPITRCAGLHDSPVGFGGRCQGQLGGNHRTQGSVSQSCLQSGIRLRRFWFRFANTSRITSTPHPFVMSRIRF